MDDFTEELYNDYLEHYGMPRRSGRYPWGSGENPYQSETDFVGRIRQLEKMGLSDEEIAKDMKMTKSQLITQRTMSKADKLAKEGKTEKEIADKLGLSTTQLRVQLSLAQSDRRGILVAKAHALKEAGYSGRAIAKELGFENDSSVRSLLNEDAKAHQEAARRTADFLKEQVNKYGMVDVGKGVERELNCSKEKLNQALYILELEEGMKTFGGGIPQMTNRNQQTNQKILCNAEISKGKGKEIYEFDKVHTITDYTYHDDTDSFEPKFVFPKSMDSKRIAPIEADKGGKERDGLVYIRPGVEDLSLGNSNYAQIRILVDYNEKEQTGYYIKGMAVYGKPKDFPPGVDVLVNTSKDLNKRPYFGDVLKPCKMIVKDGKKVIDKDNPFGATIKEGIDDNDPDNKGKDDVPNGGQSYYYDKDGNKQLSLINKKNDEGDWSKWSKKLPSQFLAKQNDKLITNQLRLSEAEAAEEYEEIMSLTNPTIKNKLLLDFAETTDKQAAKLYASALPGQKYHVILPLDNLKPNECYCPYYKDGTKLALIRFPHSGTFEIPVLTVNNNNPEGKKMIGPQAPDAIAIPFNAAEQLSGADYDGDTVLTIPITSKVKISSRKTLEGLEGWDNKAAYPYKEGMKVMREEDVQKEMGMVSNLIMDMTIQGASDKELAAAVRHSMVVIDAKKHKLDYKQSEIDNNIAALKEKYQGRINPETGRLNTGASTLITQAGAEVNVEEQKEGAWVSPEGVVREYAGDRQPGDKKLYIDPKTGKKLYSKTGRIYTEYTFYDPDDKNNKVKNPLFIVDENGKRKYQNAQGHEYIVKTAEKKALSSMKRMDTIDDAHTLSRGSDKEELYADYANYLKDLANKARKASLSTGKLQYDPNAKKIYKNEVDEIENMIKEAETNDPREREAQRLANYTYNLILQDNPGMDKGDQKKARQKALAKARATVDAHRKKISVTPKQWEAIQAGAVSNNTLERLLKFADMDQIRGYCSPKKTDILTPAKKQKIDALAANGYSTAVIADTVGYSPSTVSRYLREGK